MSLHGEIRNSVGTCDIRDGDRVDKAKVEAVERLPPPTNIKALRSFSGHVRFYRRFIKDFSKIIMLLTNLLQNYVLFNFNEKCLAAFRTLKTALVTAPIIQSPDWSQPFEMNHVDDKELIEDNMRDDHLYHILDKDLWMINIIRAIRKKPLDHLDKNAQRRVMDETRKLGCTLPLWALSGWSLAKVHTKGRKIRNIK
jgi:hypothetical protein